MTSKSRASEGGNHHLVENEVWMNILFHMFVFFCGRQLQGRRSVGEMWGRNLLGWVGCRCYGTLATYYWQVCCPRFEVVCTRAVGILENIRYLDTRTFPSPTLPVTSGRVLESKLSLRQDQVANIHVSRKLSKYLHTRPLNCFGEERLAHGNMRGQVGVSAPTLSF